MLYPPMSSLLENVNNRYLLVNVVARRARQIALEVEQESKFYDEKPIAQAISEVSAGELKACIKGEYLAEEVQDEECECEEECCCEQCEEEEPCAEAEEND